MKWEQDPNKSKKQKSMEQGLVLDQDVFFIETEQK